MITKETVIKFANWYRREDVPENAEKYFGFSDEDMYNYFCSSVLSAENKSQRISEEILNKCYTLEDLIEMMITDKDGNRLNYSDVGETKDFINRYKSFKDWIIKDIPDLNFHEILFIMDNQRKVIDNVTSWYGFDRLLTALEFEQRKGLL